MLKETHALGIGTELGTRVVGHEVCPHPIQRTVRVVILIWGSEEKEGGRWRAGKGLCPTDQERRLHTDPAVPRQCRAPRPLSLRKKLGTGCGVCHPNAFRSSRISQLLLNLSNLSGPSCCVPETGRGSSAAPQSTTTAFSARHQDPRTGRNNCSLPSCTHLLRTT